MFSTWTLIIVRNSRTRTCDQVYPKNINTKGLTHLMYSFVYVVSPTTCSYADESRGFDPSTFEIVADAADIPLFPEFTKLKTSTWVLFCRVIIRRIDIVQTKHMGCCWRMVFQCLFILERGNLRVWQSDKGSWSYIHCVFGHGQHFWQPSQVHQVVDSFYGCSFPTRYDSSSHHCWQFL